MAQESPRASDRILHQWRAPVILQPLHNSILQELLTRVDFVFVGYYYRIQLGAIGYLPIPSIMTTTLTPVPGFVPRKQPSSISSQIDSSLICIAPLLPMVCSIARIAHFILIRRWKSPLSFQLRGWRSFTGVFLECLDQHQLKA